MTVKIFCCYAHEDEGYLKRLQVQLKPLQLRGLVDIWHDRDISAGTEWEQEISKQLDAAQIILLLVSPDFMASDYCYSKEMKRAIDRHKLKEARVIPIILRPVSWEDVLGYLYALPTDAKPIASSSWHHSDDAFFDIGKGISKVVEEISKQTGSPISTPTKFKEISSNDPAIHQINEADQNSASQNLRNQFDQAMIGIYKEASRIDYIASRFFHMIDENGGVETAHLLLAKAPTEGFTKLSEKKRLDFSVIFQLKHWY